MSQFKSELNSVPSDNNLYDQNGRNVFHRAAHDGDKEQVALLLRTRLRSETLDSRDNDGNTALHHACKWGRVSVIETIFSFCQDKKEIRKMLEIKNNHSKTCLDKAAMCSEVEVIRFISLFMGVDVATIRENFLMIYRNAVKSKLSIPLINLSKLAIYDYHLKRIDRLIVRADADIKAIDLSDNHLTFESVGELVRIVTQSKTLKRLNLSDNQLGKEFFFSFSSAVQQIAKELAKDNSLLEELSLRSCKLTDSDLETLIVMLKKNRTLKRLDIRNNPEITPKAIKELVNFLEKTPITLTRLEIDTDDWQLSQRLEKVFKDKGVGEIFERVDALERQNVNQNSKQSQEVADDIFLQALSELRQALSGHRFNLIDIETKRNLIRKRHEGTLSHQEALDLFVSLLNEEEQDYRNNRSKYYKDLCAFNGVNSHLEWLVENNQSREVIDLKSMWDEQAKKYQPRIENSQEKVQQDFKTKQEYFERTLQRKLSMYWLAVNCLDTKLIKGHSEIEQTMERFQTLLSLVTLLPMLSAGHHIAHGAIGFIVNMYHVVHELIEASHLVHFISHLPVAHQVLHHLAVKWTSLGKIPLEEKMLENIRDGFETLDICLERSMIIAKAISHRYEEVPQPDTLKDMENLATFTASMIIDFYRLGIHKEPQYSDFKNEDEHQKALLEGILDWLFFAGKFFYENQRPAHITIQGNQCKVTDYYHLPGLEFLAKDRHEQDLIMKCDFVMKDNKGSEVIKTDSPKMKHRKASKIEAKEFSRHLSKQKEQFPIVEKQRDKEFTYQVEFDQRALEQYKGAKEIREIEFELLTKSQRLNRLEEEIKKQKIRLLELQEQLAVKESKWEKHEIKMGQLFQIITDLYPEIKAKLKELDKDEIEKGNNKSKYIELVLPADTKNAKSTKQRQDSAKIWVKDSPILNNSNPLKQEVNEKEDHKQQVLS